MVSSSSRELLWSNPANSEPALKAFTALEDRVCTKLRARQTEGKETFPCLENSIPKRTAGHYDIQMTAMGSGQGVWDLLGGLISSRFGGRTIGMVEVFTGAALHTLQLF